MPWAGTVHAGVLRDWCENGAQEKCRVVGIAEKRYESNIETIEYRPIASGATRMAALKSGEVDFVLDPSPQDIPRLKEDKDLKVWEGDEYRIISIALDQARDELMFLRCEGQEPFQGSARANGALSKHRHECNQGAGDAGTGDTDSAAHSESGKAKDCPPR